MERLEQRDAVVVHGELALPAAAHVGARRDTVGGRARQVLGDAQDVLVEAGQRLDVLARELGRAIGGLGRYPVTARVDGDFLDLRSRRG